MRPPPDERQEWLEADGLGGFASGTAAGIRTRRYHAVLLAAATPPTGRQVLVAGIDADVVAGGERIAISSQRYAPGVVHPDGMSRLVRFEPDPWPRWTYALGNGLTVEHSLFVPRGMPITVLRWRIAGGAPDGFRLVVRPFFAGRDYHATHHENSAFRFEPGRTAAGLLWRPYDGVPGVLVSSTGRYVHHPDWYRSFEYTQEHARGLDFLEDLACPGHVEFDVASRDAVLVLGSELGSGAELVARVEAAQLASELEAQERVRRGAWSTPADRAADAYFVQRGPGTSIVAGYPWFTDWGRDTFVSLRGLALATGRVGDARQVLLAWAGAVSEGMLPNRFPDAGEVPEFNAVDASLWFVIAAHELLQIDPSIPRPERLVLHEAVHAILDGYWRGTRFGIRADGDGLLAAGVPGAQLTWMDARIGNRVVTPRIGKPVEVQALWVNALWIGAHLRRIWKRRFTQAFASFHERFWNEATGTLLDVADVDHVPGACDGTVRPNAIFAVGGLPLALVEGDRARRIVDLAEATLWTPAGLRSLAPGEPGYQGRYSGGVEARDGAYHQGTAWPWLAGPFVDAWVRVRGDSPAVRAEARARFLEPLLSHLDPGGTGHLPEVADGDPPHHPGGCPFQAWSVGEILRLDRLVLTAGNSREMAAVPAHRTADV